MSCLVSVSSDSVVTHELWGGRRLNRTMPGKYYRNKKKNMIDRVREAFLEKVFLSKTLGKKRLSVGDSRDDSMVKTFCCFV